MGGCLSYFVCYILNIAFSTQDGMLKHKGTYEIMAPEDIGYERSNDAGIVLGKLRYAILSYLKCLVENDYVALWKLRYAMHTIWKLD